ncbi:hypothetical protein BC940DRAFT_73441, partial [Gongronella butleri]
LQKTCFYFSLTISYYFQLKQLVVLILALLLTKLTLSKLTLLALLTILILLTILVLLAVLVLLIELALVTELSRLLLAGLASLASKGKGLLIGIQRDLICAWELRLLVTVPTTLALLVLMLLLILLILIFSAASEHVFESNLN